MFQAAAQSQQRSRRHLAQEASNRSEQVALEAGFRESMRVAAFAAKLEQWFACHRQQQAVAFEQATSGSCASHYDGHLCWPATVASKQAARLPCPRQLNSLTPAASELETRLPGQQHEPANEPSHSTIKTVINALQQAQGAQKVPKSIKATNGPPEVAASERLAVKGE